jgi:winged helix DNA-binding protein
VRGSRATGVMTDVRRGRVAPAPQRGAWRVPTATELETARGTNFRHRRSLRVKDVRTARAFVDDVGFCSTFYCFPEGVPCLWEAVAGRARPRWPRHSHHDPGIGLTWELKDRLPARRHVYYGKLLRGRLVLVALDLFPAFYALVRGRQRARDYREEYAAGRLSHTARRLMDGLMRERPQYTRELRANAFLLEPGRTREFERAMAELQQGLWVVNIEERYEPSFSYRWDLVEAWLPDAVRAGRRLSRAAALEQVIARYTAAAVYTTRRLLQRLYGVSASDVDDAVERLVEREVLRETAVAGWPGRWLVRSAERGRV